MPGCLGPLFALASVRVGRISADGSDLLEVILQPMHDEGRPILYGSSTQADCLGQAERPAEPVTA